MTRLKERNKNLINKLPNFFAKRFYNSPTMRFLPEYERTASKWWAFQPETIIKMLNLLGFEKPKFTIIVTSTLKEKIVNFIIIGERTVPTEKCDYDYEALIYI